MADRDIRFGKGYGYIVRNGDSGDLRVCMQRCFDCGRENWAPRVSTGTCAWCGYDANTIHEVKMKAKEVVSNG